jgi:uncharacterized protein with HEPN domain
LLAHKRGCLDRIREYTDGERARIDASRLVQDAVIRNLQTLAESSQRLSTEIKATEAQNPWRELSGFRIKPDPTGRLPHRRPAAPGR